MRSYLLVILVLLSFGSMDLFGQCNWMPGSATGSATPSCNGPISVVQANGYMPLTDGLLHTRIWTETTTPIAVIDANSIAGSDPIDAIFTGFSAVDSLPVHPGGLFSGDVFYLPSLGVKYESTNTSNSNNNDDDPNRSNPNSLRYYWPSEGNNDSSREQFQQDGWLVIPNDLTCIRFSLESSTEKSARLYLSNNDSVSGLEIVLDGYGLSNNNNNTGDVMVWNIPPNLPTMGGSNGFRYTRLRFYHHDPDGIANSLVSWDIGDGLETIDPVWFQSVPGPNSIGTPPMQIRPYHAEFIYQDSGGSNFERDTLVQNGALLGQAFPELDPRFQTTTLNYQADVLTPNFCQPSFACGSWSRKTITRLRPDLSGESFEIKWSANADSDPTADPSHQLDYLEGFSSINNGKPSHNDPLNFDSDGIDTLGGLGHRFEFNNNAIEQFTQDAWLAVPAQVPCIQFKLGDHSPHKQASALWIGTTYSDMVEVAEEVNGFQSGGTYCLPGSTSTAQNGWQWLRVRVYTHNKDSSHNSLIKWDMGDGFVNIPSYCIAPATSPTNGTPPNSIPFVIDTTFYGLEDNLGQLWQENGTQLPTTPIDLNLPFDRIYQVDTLTSCGGNPGCLATLNADPCNLSPIANEDSVDAIQFSTTTFSTLLANDSDANPSDSNTIFINSAFGSAYGTLTVQGGTAVIYNHSATHSFSDSFSYEVCDDGSPNLCDTTIVIITVSADTDKDSIPDALDLDDDNDGIPDSLENAHAVSNFDSDDDLIPDSLDLDSDNDGIPDIIEAGGLDPNQDGFVPVDINGYLILDPAPVDGWDQSVGAGFTDHDQDGIPDWIDLDSDNDGIYDIRESGGTDNNFDGRVDIASFPMPDFGWQTGSRLPNPTDSDNDTIPNYIDLDSDNDGIPDIIEERSLATFSLGRIDSIIDNLEDGADDLYMKSGFEDQDQDGQFPNFLDLDSDNDGIADLVEGGGIDPDTNGFVPVNPDSTLASDPTPGDGWDESVIAVLVNTDNDIIDLPDWLDLDSDNDGLWDILEAGGNAPNTSGTVSNFGASGFGWSPTERLLVVINSDNDSVPDRIDLDSDNDGISDLSESQFPDSIFDGMLDNIVDLDSNGADDSRMLDNFYYFGLDIFPEHRDLDADDDGIPDILEAGGMDTDANGFIDVMNITSGWEASTRLMDSLDADLDGVPNRRDLDSDNDGLFDLHELIAFANYQAIDNDRNGMVDSTILNNNDGWLPITLTTNDPDQDNVPSYLDLDSDNDGLCDRFESTGDTNIQQGTVIFVDVNGDGAADNSMVTRPMSSDNDSIPNHLDLDSDQDGIPDALEILSGDITLGRFDLSAANDQNGDGWIDTSYFSILIINADQDTFPNHLDLDSDNDGIPDLVEWGGFGAVNLGIVADTIQDGNSDGWDDDMDSLRIGNADQDSFPNHLDLDSDNDGVYDILEAGALAHNSGRVASFFCSDSSGWDDDERYFNNHNTDNDSVPNRIDLDSDNDGLSDFFEAGYVTVDSTGMFLIVVDSNQDGAHDMLVSTLPDPDQDGFADLVDLDSDNDGIPDLWEVDQALAPNYDTNEDGLIDLPIPPDTSGWYSAARILMASDFDNDGVPDHHDLDSDNDLFYDLYEVTKFTFDSTLDADTNGRIETSLPSTQGWVNTLGLTLPLRNTDLDNWPDQTDLDSDNDGLPDLFENLSSTGPILADTVIPPGDLDGALDFGMHLIPIRTDQDAFPNHLDLDSDNDGIPDIRECFGLEADSSGKVTPLTGDSTGWNDIAIASCPNNDPDDFANYIDLDSDNDGLSDLVESDPNITDTIGFYSQFIDNIPMGGDGWRDESIQAGKIDSDLSFVSKDYLADWVDLDSDNDGLFDHWEAGGNSPNGMATSTSDSSGWNADHRLQDLNLAWAKDNIPNRIDLDSDDDGISDFSESLPIGSPIKDLSPFDGVFDGFQDTSGDGAHDSTIVSTQDFDGDGIPNHLDLDSDGDGLPDIIEAQWSDFDGDGMIDNSISPQDNGWASDDRNIDNIDSDSDGVKDRLDLDSDQDGFYDLYESLGFKDSLQVWDNMVDGRIDWQDSIDGFIALIPFVSTAKNSDNDAIPDHLDLDSDNDGLSDFFEGEGSRTLNSGRIPEFTDSSPLDGADDDLMITLSNTWDFDGDSILNHLDRDSDNDGVCDLYESFGLDSDVDGYTEQPHKDSSYFVGWVESPQLGTKDSDWDGFYNHVDLDSDNDGIPDVSEASGVYQYPLGKIEVISDQDHDGWDDSLDVLRPLNTDALLFALLNRPGSNYPDSDNTPDLYDWDSDNDGIFDYLESTYDSAFTDELGRILSVNPGTQGWDFNKGTIAPVNTDASAEGNAPVPDYRDPDSDNDGIPDFIEYELQVPDCDTCTNAFDCDGDGSLNYVDSDKCKIHFFQGVSPNGDGFNDEYLALGTVNYERVSVSIFNRWGNLVYKNLNWNGRWLGECNQSNCYGALPDGIYFYVCKYWDGDEEPDNSDDPEDDFGGVKTNYVYLRRR